MIRRLLMFSCLALALAQASCATVKTLAGPDGSPHYLINCPTSKQCYEKATELCGKYQIVNSSSRVTGGEVTSSSTELLIKCNR